MAALISSGTELTCPRCKQEFQCQADQIAACGCSGIVFTSAQKEAIGRQYDRCLCRACLLHLQQQVFLHSEA
jgi:hypothetical protein